MSTPPARLKGELSPHADPAACVLWDPSLGFHQIVPAGPTRVAPLRGGPGDTRGSPPLPVRADSGSDLILQCAELSIELRYRLLEPGEPKNPAKLAVELAETWAAQRSPYPLRPRLADEGALARWGVSGAASGIYPLLARDSAGATQEDLLVLVRGGRALLLTASYDEVRVAPILRGFFDALRLGSIRWTGGGDRPAMGPLWPESTFIGSGCVPELTSETRFAARALIDALKPWPADVSGLVMRLRVVFRQAGAPFDTPGPGDRAAWAELLTGGLDHAELADELRRGLDHVHTMRDLRGYVMMWLFVVAETGAYAGPA